MAGDIIFFSVAGPVEDYTGAQTVILQGFFFILFSSGPVERYTPLAARIRARRDAFCVWRFRGFSLYISSEGLAKLQWVRGAA
jgi:hypothetical protein